MSVTLTGCGNYRLFLHGLAFLFVLIPEVDVADDEDDENDDQEDDADDSQVEPNLVGAGAGRKDGAGGGT